MDNTYAQTTTGPVLGQSWASPLIANRSNYSTWEDFQLVDAGNGNIALKSQADGLYVNSGNGSDPLIANSPALGSNEEFVYTFTDGTIKPTPSTLTDYNIGSPGSSGYSSLTGSTYTIGGGGADIWNNADQFNYLAETETGDQTIITEVTSMTNTDPWAKEGVMFRDSSASNAIFIDLVATESNGVSLQWRSSTGTGSNTIQAASVGTPSPTNPVWLKLVKNGTVYTGFYSLDGTTWNPVAGPTTVTLSNSPYLIGLAVTAHNNRSLNTVIFVNSSVSGAGI